MSGTRRRGADKTAYRRLCSAQLDARHDHSEPQRPGTNSSRPMIPRGLTLRPQRKGGGSALHGMVVSRSITPSTSRISSPSVRPFACTANSRRSVPTVLSMSARVGGGRKWMVHEHVRPEGRHPQYLSEEPPWSGSSAAYHKVGGETMSNKRLIIYVCRRMNTTKTHRAFIYTWLV